MTWLAVAHHLPERTRLRCPSVRRDAAACDRLARALAAVPGVREVRIRPYTASAVIEHGEGVAVDALVAAARGATGCERVLAPGEAPPPDPRVPPLSSLAQTTARAVRDLDRDLRRASGGAVDLGTSTTFAFISAGAAAVLATGQLPMPPWFNLAWWGFRTFVTAEQAEIAAARDAAKRDDGA